MADATLWLKSPQKTAWDLGGELCVHCCRFMAVIDLYIHQRRTTTSNARTTLRIVFFLSFSRTTPRQCPWGFARFFPCLMPTQSRRQNLTTTVHKKLVFRFLFQIHISVHDYHLLSVRRGRDGWVATIPAIRNIVTTNYWDYGQLHQPKHQQHPLILLQQRVRHHRWPADAASPILVIAL